MKPFRTVRALLLAPALLLTPQACPASTPTPDAASFAASVDAHYNTLRALAVQFTQSYDGMGLHRVERGTLLLSKGGRTHAGRMRWTYTEPAGKLFVLDGSNGYFYTPGQSEVQRVPARTLVASGDDLRSPLALLLGHSALAKQLNGLTLTPGPGGDSTLRGVPKGLEKRVASLQVIADATGTIHALVVEDLDGARNRFEFSGEQPNPVTPAGAFTFVPLPGTHIVDGMPPI
ncbi:outer membrane lipoprotein carrier protein LolA [Acidipila sp. EB88]|uniref:LolA family protein n=1 Tax=Acidipila sp. EB88 TaxID=2305226 RepID=UPI000F5FD1A8|nr:outer membrane lipoprotein carrier protein LolA [Acidipila sp. EB88]RRA48980.1 outer membrane lipoprotein carrier protein LolA [Acidipila sp. EB88]